MGVRLERHEDLSAGHRPQFWDDFFAHKIAIAPGDALLVRLRIRQVRAPDIGVFINDSYEVIEVVKHIQRTRQADFPFDDDAA